MLSRRSMLASASAAFLPACSSKRGTGYSGFAFIANEEGKAIAAVNMTAFAVTRHIPLDAAPVQVAAHYRRRSVYVLTPSNATLHEISSSKLVATRRTQLRGYPLSMQLTPDGEALWVATRSPNLLVRVPLESFKVEAQIPLGAEPYDLDLAREANLAAVSYGPHGAFALLDTATQQTLKVEQIGQPLSFARFRYDSRQVMVGNLEQPQLSIFSAPSAELVTHLPLPVRPENMCVKTDGGQMFLTGKGRDGVAIVYPYRTEVAETILAGHMPGPMAAVTTPNYDYLFIANPSTGDVTVMNIGNRKVLGSVTVGKNPNTLAITPDNQYALILNQSSGDLAVIRIPTITPSKARAIPLFTMIPVGSKPVSVAFHSV